MQTQVKFGTDKLTKAQRIVCDLVRQGFSEREIAAELSKSTFTINNHMRGIYAAYGVHSRAKLFIKLFEEERAALPKKPR